MAGVSCMMCGNTVLPPRPHASLSREEVQGALQRCRGAGTEEQVQRCRCRYSYRCSGARAEIQGSRCKGAGEQVQG